jgi:hypothetical protein
MCGHRYSSLTFVRRADRRGTSERSLGEGRYWRVVESRRCARKCQEYFLHVRDFSPRTRTTYTPDFRLFSSGFRRVFENLTMPCAPGPQSPQFSGGAFSFDSSSAVSYPLTQPLELRPTPLLSQMGGNRKRAGSITGSCSNPRWSCQLRRVCGGACHPRRPSRFPEAQGWPVPARWLLHQLGSRVRDRQKAIGLA